jgi:hypothetical protein
MTGILMCLITQENLGGMVHCRSFEVYITSIICLHQRKCRASEKCFFELWGIVPHSETMKNVYMNMCPKQSHFRAMALLNFRTFDINPHAILQLTHQHRLSVNV